MPDVVVTRVRSGGPPRQSRNLEERLLVRFPSLYRRLAELTFRVLAPRSRLRRAGLRRQIVSGWLAYNREDFELMVVRYAPEVEFVFPEGQQTLGLSGTFRGHAAMAAALREQAGNWASAQVEPVYVLDLGERVLVLGSLHVRGGASGMQLQQELAQLLTVREGLAERDQSWFSWEEGLRAAGLDPGALALPRRRREPRQAASGVD